MAFDDDVAALDLAADAKRRADEIRQAEATRTTEDLLAFGAEVGTFLRRNGVAPTSGFLWWHYSVDNHPLKAEVYRFNLARPEGWLLEGLPGSLATIRVPAPWLLTADGQFLFVRALASRAPVRSRRPEGAEWAPIPVTGTSDQGFSIYTGDGSVSFNREIAEMVRKLLPQL